MRSGQTLNSEMKGFFNRVADVFRSIYSALRNGIGDVRLNDEIIEYYDSLYGFNNETEADTSIHLNRISRLNQEEKNSKLGVYERLKAKYRSIFSNEASYGKQRVTAEEEKAIKEIVYEYPKAKVADGVWMLDGLKNDRHDMPMQKEFLTAQIVSRLLGQDIILLPRYMDRMLNDIAGFLRFDNYSLSDGITGIASDGRTMEFKMCSFRNVEANAKNALDKADIAVIVTYAKNGLNNVSKKNVSSKGLVYLINSFVDNGVEIMQKNNLSNEWREVCSDTKSKLRIDNSIPVTNIIKVFENVKSENQDPMDYEVYSRAMDNKSSEILFQTDEGSITEKNGTLILTHELSEEKLKEVDSLGGMPMPSLAISKPELDSNFGDVILLGNKAMAMSVIDKGYVFNRDIWSPTVPKAEYTLTAKNKKLVGNWMKSVGITSTINQYYENEYSDPKEFSYRLSRMEDVKKAYIKENGIEIETPYKTAADNFPKAIREKAIEFVKNNPVDYEEYEAYKNALSEYIRPEVEILIDKEKVKVKSFKKFLFDYYLGEERINELIQYAENPEKEFVDEKALAKLIDSKAPQEDVQSWIYDNIKDYYSEPYLTIDGKRYDYKLTNIFKEMMNKRMVGGAEDNALTFSTGLTNSYASRRLESRAQMATEERLLSAENESGEKVDTLYKKYHEMAAKYFKRTNTWEALDEAGRALAEYLKSDDRSYKLMESSLKKRHFTPVSTLVDTAMELATSIDNMSRKYFEAKPDRIMQLSEFSVALVPEDASEETLSILKNAGLETSTYDKARRNTAIKDYLDSNDNKKSLLLFQTEDREQMENAREQIKTIEDLYADGEKDIEYCKKQINEMADETDSLFSYQRADLKGKFRTGEKIKNDYGGNPRKLKDLFGGTIVFDTKEDVENSFEELLGSERSLYVYDKKKMTELPTGYRDAKINFLAPHGTVYEVILIEEYIDTIKNGVRENGERISKGIGHLLYEITRQLVVRDISKNLPVGKELTPNEMELINDVRYKLDDVQRELYTNPQFDGNTLLQSIENAFSLVRVPLASGIPLSIDNEVISLRDFMSSASLTSLMDSLSHAIKYAGQLESSKSQTSKFLNLSKSSSLINSDNQAETQTSQEQQLEKSLTLKQVGDDEWTERAREIALNSTNIEDFFSKYRENVDFNGAELDDNNIRLLISDIFYDTRENVIDEDADEYYYSEEDVEEDTVVDSFNVETEENVMPDDWLEDVEEETEATTEESTMPDDWLSDVEEEVNSETETDVNTMPSDWLSDEEEETVQEVENSVFEVQKVVVDSELKESSLSNPKMIDKNTKPIEFAAIIAKDKKATISFLQKLREINREFFYNEAEDNTSDEDREVRRTAYKDIADENIAPFIRNLVLETKNSKLGDLNKLSDRAWHIVSGMINANPEFYMDLYARASNNYAWSSNINDNISKVKAELGLTDSEWNSLSFTKRRELALAVKDKELRDRILKGTAEQKEIEGYIKRAEERARIAKEEVDLLVKEREEELVNIKDENKKKEIARLKAEQELKAVQSLKNDIQNKLEKRIRAKEEALRKNGVNTTDTLIHKDLVRAKRALDVKERQLREAKEKQSRERVFGTYKNTISKLYEDIKKYQERIKELEEKNAITEEEAIERLINLTNAIANNKKEEALKNARESYRQKMADYKAKRRVRSEMARMARSIMRKPSPGVALEEAKKIREIQAQLDPNFRREKMKNSEGETFVVEDLKKLIKEDPNNVIFTTFSDDQIKRLTKQSLNEMNLATLENTYREVLLLRKAGLEKRQNEILQRRLNNQAILTELMRTISENKNYHVVSFETSLDKESKNKKLSSKLRDTWYKTLNMARKAQDLDNGQKGAFYNLLIRKKRYHQAKELEAKGARIDRVVSLGKELNVLDRLSNAITIEFPDGNRRFTYSELAYFLLSEKNEDNSDALSYGTLVSTDEKMLFRKEAENLLGADEDAIKDYIRERIIELGDLRYSIVLSKAKELIADDKAMMQFIQAIEDDLNSDRFSLVVDLARKLYNIEVEKEEYYLPINRNDFLGQEPGESIKNDLLNTVKGTKASVEKGFINSRIKINPENQNAIQFDLFKVWMNAVIVFLLVVDAVLAIALGFSWKRLKDLEYLYSDMFEQVEDIKYRVNHRRYTT